MANQWKKSEKDILKNNKNKSMDELSRLLPNRSKPAIRSRMSKLSLESKGKFRITTKKIVYAILSLICSIGLIYLGIYIEKASIEPHANVVFHPHIEDSSYLPIMINNGPKQLTGISLQVKTCHMKEFENFPIPDLIENQEFPVHLRDEETIYALDKILKNKDFKCDPMDTSASTQCFIKTYVVDGKIYAPPQQCKKYRCGYCSYTLKLNSNEFSMNYSNFFLAPIEISTFSLNIVPNNPIDVSGKNMTDFSPIGVSIFSPYDLCMFDTKNNYQKCKNLPIIPVFDKPVTMSISPVNKSLGNLSINITQTI